MDSGTGASSVRFSGRRELYPREPSFEGADLRSSIMRIRILMLAAGAMALAPAMAAPGGNGGQGSTHGSGWDHLNGPDSTGQPGAECGEDEALFSPGHASDARGSAFNEDGIGHSVYAGELPQNSRNTASVSQYDTACLGGPPAG